MPFRLCSFECSLDTSPLDSLERLVRLITRERLRDWFHRIEGTEEVALLTTCHRVELVLLVRSAEEIHRWREILPGSRNAWRVREGRAVVSHLFRVAAGRESLARGEGEVRHQVRAAGRRVESRHPRPVLREFFGRASDAAEELAPSVPSSHSIAAVAAARLMTFMHRPNPSVLVIGSGTVGRQVTENLASKARVTVLFHRHPPEPSWLRASGARAARLDQLKSALAEADAAVTAAKFGDRGLRAADLPRDHPLLLIDLGMPRNIDPDVRNLPNVQLIDLENMHSASDPAAPSDGIDEKLEELVDRCSDRLELLLLEPWIGALRRAAEAVRRSELATARRFLGKLDPEQELAVERLTQRLVARLMLPPTERIRSLPPGPDGDLRRRWAIEMLRPLAHDL
jgi:glutamyl-tRNA reductase